MAKGKKKANSEAPPGLGNNGGGDRAEAIRNACQRLAQMDVEIKGLQEDRANFKAEVIKGQLGMKIADFNMAYRLHGLEGSDRADLFDTLRETFRALGVGGQLDWLEATANASRPATSPQASAESLAAANQGGLDAGLAGRNRESNPYEEGAPEHLKWDAGWVGGQRQNVARMAGSTEAAPAH